MRIFFILAFSLLSAVPTWAKLSEQEVRAVLIGVEEDNLNDRYSESWWTREFRLFSGTNDEWSLDSYTRQHVQKEISRLRSGKTPLRIWEYDPGHAIVVIYHLWDKDQSRLVTSSIAHLVREEGRWKQSASSGIWLNYSVLGFPRATPAYLDQDFAKSKRNFLNKKPKKTLVTAAQKALKTLIPKYDLGGTLSSSKCLRVILCEGWNEQRKKSTIKLLIELNQPLTSNTYSKYVLFEVGLDDLATGKTLVVRPLDENGIFDFPKVAISYELAPQVAFGPTRQALAEAKGAYKQGCVLFASWCALNRLDRVQTYFSSDKQGKVWWQAAFPFAKLTWQNVELVEFSSAKVKLILPTRHGKTAVVLVKEGNRWRAQSVDNE
ncbi:hypothetical protein HYW32_03345 [Candidatus Berkelbacteria bacterium]|nr:hypothetical protein [Candidatus Berkelbacteria bacterium]